MLCDWLLATKQPVEGMVLLDMMGFKAEGDDVFQLNPGDSEGSMKLAKIALDASGTTTKLEPRVLDRYHDESYLYNTDGHILDNYGVPVLFINEHMNRKFVDRDSYHTTKDNPANINWSYATDLGKVAIETLARAAGVK